MMLRRGGPAESPPAKELRRLTELHRVRMIGPIRQEILSGIRDSGRFARLVAYLSEFPDLHLEEQDYVEAARFYNACRARGIQGSHTDFLICAAAYRRELAIFTLDLDFERYSKIIPISFHEPPLFSADDESI
jgi:predicted nucleic acid-binding protein